MKMQEPQEPPTIPHMIPYVGHMLGLVWNKMDYYGIIRQQNSLPIYSLDLLGSKLYIVNTPELINAVQKQRKTLAFAPLAAKFATRVCGTSAQTNDILSKNVNGEEGEWGFSLQSYKFMHAALAPGEGLDAMQWTMVQNLSNSCEKLLPPKDGAPVRINLWKWLRHEITMATTNAVYGAMNPFKDPKVEAGWWDFDSGFALILVNAVPSWTARKAYYGRETVVRAFEEYFALKGHERGSILAQNRFQVSFDHEVPMEDIARLEIGGCIASLVNTTPSTFWMIFHVFSNSEILQLLRDELGTVLETKVDSNGETVQSFDITKLRSDCPILNSTFQEMLRLSTQGPGVRVVLEDTVLDGQYLLKKGNVVQMPRDVVHRDSSVWGPTVDDFQPERFMQKRRTGAFQAFGGGSTLCPGRHLATTEVLAFVAMLVLRCDLKPTLGEWNMPKHGSPIAAAVGSPDIDIEVEVIPRKGRWTFSLADYTADDDQVALK